MLFLIKKLVTEYFCLPLCFIVFPVSPSFLPHLLLSDSISLSISPSILSSFIHLLSEQNQGDFMPFEDFKCIVFTPKGIHPLPLFNVISSSPKDRP